MAYTDDQIQAARQELARRELARRQQSNIEQSDEEIPYTPPPPVTGWGAIGQDAMNLPGKAIDWGMDLPNQMGQSAKQLYNQPGRAFKNLLAGVGELGIGVLNTPHDIFSYLGEKQVIPEKLKKYNELPFTHIPNLGIEDKMGIGDTQEGDKFLRQLPGIILGGKAIAPGVKYSAKSIVDQAKHRPLKKQLAELEKQVETSSGDHALHETNYNALKEFLERQPGFETSNPNALERKSTEAREKSQALQKEAEIIPEEFRSFEEPAIPDKTPLSLVEPVKANQTDVNKLPKTEVNEDNVKQAESLFKTHEQKSAEHESQISDYLGEGNAHRKRVAEKLNPILEKRQSAIGKEYDQYVNDLKDKQVTLSNPREAKVITEDIQNLLKTGDTSSPEMIKLNDELHNLGKGETMPANEFVSAYRSLKGLSQKTRSSAYGKSPQEFDRLIQSADAMDLNVGKMQKIIDNGLGEDNLETLKKLNHRYATEIAPLFKNKFFQHMQKNNKAPSNMIEQLTNEPYVKSTNPNQITGTQILNDIIKSDPELLKNVVGERFAHKPEGLHAWDEAAHEFIQHMPELQEMRTNHFESKQNEHQSKQALDRAKHEHQSQREEATKKDRETLETTRQENTKARETAAEQTRQKKVEVQKENQRKQSEYEQKNKHHKLQQQIKELDEKHNKLSEAAKNMQEKSKQKNLSLKNKIEVENQLSKTKKQLATLDKQRTILRKTAKTILIGSATAIAGAPIVNIIKSIFVGK